MNVFDVLREKLKESQERYDDVSFAEMNENGHTLDFEYANGKKDGVSESIEIVNQVEQEYNKEIKRDAEPCDATSIESAIKQFEEKLAIPDYREQIPDYYDAMELAVKIMKNIPKQIPLEQADYAHEASYIEGWNDCLEKISKNGIETSK